MSDLHDIGTHVDDPTEPTEEPQLLPSFEELAAEQADEMGDESLIEEPVAEAEAEEETEVGTDPLVSLVFDPKHQDDFEGLLHLGELRHEFVWANHTFLIRTLKVDELLQVALLTKDFAGSYGADRAYVTALVAAALVEVDGEPVYQAIGRDEDHVAKKYNYIRKNWYSQTIDAVYSHLPRLEARAQTLLDAMGEA